MSISQKNGYNKWTFKQTWSLSHNCWENIWKKNSRSCELFLNKIEAQMIFFQNLSLIPEFISLINGNLEQVLFGLSYLV